MVIIYVSVKAKEDAINAFERTLREVVVDALQTAGCLKYEWYRRPDDKHAYVIYGEFDSKEHFHAYLNSAVVKRIGEELIPLLVGGPQFNHYEASLLEGN